MVWEILRRDGLRFCSDKRFKWLGFPGNLHLFFLYAIVIRMVQSSLSTSILSVRVSPAERAVLEAASQEAHTNLSDFVRRASIEAAEASLLERNIVSIPAKDWESFEAWVSRPAVKNPALQKLSAKKLTWRT
jgi:uncharacterized protein (DUF1778 family)